jgi:hypothetical protein
MSNDIPKALIGNWSLVDISMEFQDSGEKLVVPWQGRMIVQASGEFMWIAHLKDRPLPKTPEERALVIATMGAESGTLTINGDQMISSITLAADVQQVGITTSMTFQIEGKRLHSIRAWRPRPSDGRIFRGISTWVRD